jgi:cell division protein FtsQ
MIAMLRLLAWLLAVALVALPVVAVVNGWVGGAQWPLRTLRVQGELQQVDQARLRATVLPYAKKGFFAVELDRIQAAVGALPWVERAEVRKHWPDVLEVRISEHRPFARWGEDRLLSEHGTLFSADGAQAHAGLPRLDGPETQVAEVVALYNQARERLANAGGVRGAGMDKRGSWSITLSDGTEVVLGRNDPEQRLERFAPLLPRLVAQHPGQRLVRADLRYTNGFSLSWAALPKPAALPAPMQEAPPPQSSPASSAGSETRQANT